MKYIMVINGPSMNMLGRRQTEIYGSRTLDDLCEELTDRYVGRIELIFEQYSGEGEIINAILGAQDDSECIGIVINPGAYSHYSYAIADAIASVSLPVVEVHISNIHAREPHRHTSVTGACCTGVIAGFGFESYALAIEFLLG